MEKILSVVDKIAPFKDPRIKNNTQDQDWFDDEVAKAIKLREERQQNCILMKTYVKKLNIMQ